MTEPATYFRDTVRAFLERTGTAPARLGADVLGDPSFVYRLMQGRNPLLVTADRVLAFMGAAPIGPVFRREVEAFLRATRINPHVLGHHAAGDPSFVVRLRRGSSPRLDTVARVRAWMAAHCGAVECAASDGAAGAGPAEDIDNGKGGDGSVNDTPIEYLSTRKAAAFLGLSPRTLDRYRVTGQGPVFHRFGTRIRYTRGDLDAWAAARRITSTSDVRKMTALAVTAAAFALSGAPEIALAASDTTFQGPLDTVKDMVAGTGGQLAAALAVGVALVGSVLRFNAMQLFGAVGVGIAAGAGTGIVTGLVGTAIV